MSKKQQISIPHIALEVNNSCNQNCIFCYNHIPHSNKNKGSNYIKLKKVLKQVYFHANVDSITFTGGEPLIEERLPELVLFAKMKNSLTTIISNGTLFSDQIINNLVLVKNDLFQLPIHSFSDEIHDKMTGLIGSHEKSVITIQKLKAKKANVVAVIVLTSQNAETISKTIDFIINLGIKQISVDRYNIGGVNKKTADKILPDINLLKKSYLLINSKARALKLNITSNVCTPHCVINPADYPFIRFGNCPENPLHFPITLDISGNVRVCNHSPIITGNIFKQDFSKILNTTYVKSWNINIPDYCKNCKLWSICRGGCRAASEQNGMNNKSVDPIVSILKNY